MKSVQEVMEEVQETMERVGNGGGTEASVQLKDVKSEDLISVAEELRKAGVKVSTKVDSYNATLNISWT